MLAFSPALQHSLSTTLFKSYVIKTYLLGPSYVHCLSLLLPQAKSAAQILSHALTDTMSMPCADASNQYLVQIWLLIHYAQALSHCRSHN